MKKFLGRALLAVILAGLLLAGWYGWASWSRADELMKTNPLQDKIAQIQQSSKYVSSDQIPQFLKEATIAVEDDRFEKHHGVDPLSLARAALSHIIPSMDKSGGSTITQQLVKNMYSKFNQGLSWKGTEMILAMKLEDMCSKDEILTLYLNIINYGDNFTGIKEAANGYFGIEPIQLSDGQASLLAGIPQSPSNFQLSNHFAQASDKQRVVLQAMVRCGYITQEQADEIFNQPVYPIIPIQEP